MSQNTRITLSAKDVVYVDSFQGQTALLTHNQLFRINDFLSKVETSCVGGGGLSADEVKQLIEAGLPCEVLCPGAADWQHGTVRLSLEFVPGGTAPQMPATQIAQASMQPSPQLQAGSLPLAQVAAPEPAMPQASHEDSHEAEAIAPMDALDGLDAMNALEMNPMEMNAMEEMEELDPMGSLDAINALDEMDALDEMSGLEDATFGLEPSAEFSPETAEPSADLDAAFELDGDAAFGDLGNDFNLEDLEETAAPEAAIAGFELEENPWDSSDLDAMLINS